MNKKKLVIVGLVVVVIVITVVSFLFFGRDNLLNENPSFGNNAPFGTPGEFTTGGLGSPEGTFSLEQNETFVVTSGETYASLRKISDAPVSGAKIFVTGSTTVIRFLEKATGHVYETEIDTNLIRRITNTTIPKIEEAVWTRDPDTLILRYEKDGLIESFYANISKGSSTSTTSELSTLEGVFLPQNILELSMSEGGDRIAYLVSGNPSRILISRPDGGNPSLVWTTPIQGWRISWASESTLSVATKASNTSSGFLYLLGMNGDLEKVLGNFNGLTGLVNPTHTRVVYSEFLSGGLNFFNLNRESGLRNEMPFQILPEKCVWSRNNSEVLFCSVPSNPLVGDYPDIWYKGLTSFSDKIWSYSFETGETKLLADLETLSGEKIDAIDLELSSDESLLLFRNKKDFTLWTLELTDGAQPTINN
jgi:hypothetical protein